MHGDTELAIFDCRPGDAVGGDPGTISSVGDEGVVVALNGGALHVHRVRPKGSKKVTAAEYATEGGLKAGDRIA